MTIITSCEDRNTLQTAREQAIAQFVTKKSPLALDLDVYRVLQREFGLRRKEVDLALEGLAARGDVRLDGRSGVVMVQAGGQ